jgi:uncharacterized protein YdaU (DUF1376 family)
MSAAFMLNVDDWLSSTDIAAMSADEERGLMHLLMHQWKSLLKTGAGLPNDEISLARWALCSLRTWRKRIGPRLMQLFTIVAGRLHNERLAREFENFRARCGARSLAAMTAAKARWGQRRGGLQQVLADALRMPTASATHANRMRDACVTHATAIQRTEYTSGEVSVESVDSTPLPLEEQNQCGEETGGAMPANLTAKDVQETRELLKTAARQTGIDRNKEPDFKLAAQVLVAAGSVAALVSHLAELGKRNLNHVDSYGYFLRTIEARGNQTTRMESRAARAG